MKRNTNQVRIIGGLWRGRKLEFPSTETLRPTHDRIRETLFNWLSPYIVDAICLDLFAGSGALGFEALSRGAREVVFVDQDKLVIEALKKSQQKLSATAATIFQSEAPSDKLNFAGKQFDVVFLDPPYQQQLLEQCCQWLAKNNLVVAGGLVYLEYALNTEPPELPPGWEPYKQNETATLCYRLVRVGEAHEK